MSPLGEAIASALAKTGLSALTGLFKKPAAEVREKIHKATDRAQEHFYEAYGDRYGSRSTSFLAYQETWDIISRSVSAGAAPLTVEALRGGQDPKWPPIDDEALAQFIQFLDEELRRDWQVDDILTAKRSHQLLQETHHFARDVAERATATLAATSLPILGRGEEAGPYTALLDRTKARLESGRPQSALGLLALHAQGIELQLRNEQMRFRSATRLLLDSTLTNAGERTSVIPNRLWIRAATFAEASSMQMMSATVSGNGRHTRARLPTLGPSDANLRKAQSLRIVLSCTLVTGRS